MSKPSSDYFPNCLQAIENNTTEFLRTLESNASGCMPSEPNQMMDTSEFIFRDPEQGANNPNNAKEAKKNEDKPLRTPITNLKKLKEIT